MFKLIILGVLSSLLIIINVSSSQLVLDSVSIVTRHGDRNPTRTFKNDPFNQTYWDENGGFGNLTKNGKKRIEFAAQFYKDKYKDLLKDDSIVWTSSSKRVIDTAEIFMEKLGIVAKFETNDSMLNMYTKCDKAENLFEKHMKNISNSLMPSKEFIEFLSNKTGEEFSSYDTTKQLRTFSMISDTLTIERDELKLNVEDWIKDENTTQILKEIQRKVYGEMFNSEEILYLRVGLLLAKIDNDIQSPNDSQKFNLYSTHDINQIALLETLNLYDKLSKEHLSLPTYVSGIIFEVYRNESDKNDRYIRIKYQQFLNNNDEGEFIPTEMDINPDFCQSKFEDLATTFCTLEQFSTKVLKDKMLKDWNDECKMNNDNNSSSQIRKPFITMIIIIVSCSLLINSILIN